jgi:trehalose 6-phosphate phosphatase
MNARIASPPPPPPNSQFALFLDIDGTLLDHQAHPEAVMVDDALRGLLRETVQRLDGAVALVTGRTIAMADRLFLPLELPVAGIYGLEMRMKAGEPAISAVEPESLAAVTERLTERYSSVEGVYFERKGPVLAVHIRAAPHMMDDLMSAAQQALPELGDDYRILAGNAGLELIPVGGVKAAAIERFMSVAPFAGRTPVFLGDDTSDESGFEYVNSVGGLSIRVKPNGPTAARATLPNVAAVLAWIKSGADQTHLSKTN